MATYRVKRMFFRDDRRARTIVSGLTLAEAQDHCRDPETSSRTCTSATKLRYTERNGQWFDGYEEE